MKIIVNATPMLNIATGIGRYLKELYSAISRLHPEHEIQYFNGAGLSTRMPVPPRDNGVWTAAVNLAWKFPWIFPYIARRVVHEKRTRTFLKLSSGFDIYHEAGYFPFKPARGTKTVFTIHDMSLKRLPQCHPRERVRFFNTYFEPSLGNTDAVITPSQFTKDEIKTGYPGLEIPICPTPLGFDPAIFYRRSHGEVASLKKRLGLPDRYLLFVGTADPRKNIKSLVKAIEYLPGHIKLVCTGWSGWAPLIQNRDQALRLKNRLITTGYVGDQDLAGLYTGARAFVYPSVYEGFGLPVLEAMACGCPVVCSNRTSLPEVAGNAAIMVDPHDSDAMAKALDEIFSSDGLYSDMSQKSLARAEKFSWSKTAEKTLALFAEIAGQ